MIKQAIILAAGKSSRFHPYNINGHKSGTTLLSQPIIYRTIQSLEKIGLKEIIVVISPNQPDFQILIKNYPATKSKVTIIYQKKPLGMANAIISTEKQLDEQFLVVNSNHFNASQLIVKMLKVNSDIVLACKPTDQPNLHGIVTIKNNLATALIEKPQQKIENPHRIVGVYLLSKKFVATMKTLPAEEYLLETALNDYMQENQVQVVKTKHSSPSLKYPWHLLTIKNYFLKAMSPYVSKSSQISETAIIKGKVYIDNEAIVEDFAIIEGPAYIGKNVVVGQHCIVRKNSVLESGAQIQRFCDVANSILMKNTHCHSGFIGDSIIGEDCRIGAGFVTANRRIDRKEIITHVKGKMTKTGLSSLGAIIGEEVKIGIKVGTMPGVIIDNNEIILPGSMIKKNMVNKN